MRVACVRSPYHESFPRCNPANAPSAGPRGPSDGKGTALFSLCEELSEFQRARYLCVT
jgi:hypothetical protein